MENEYRVEILDEPRDPSRTKVCRHCGTRKGHWRFSNDRRNRDELDCYCLECRRMMARRRREMAARESEAV